MTKWKRHSRADIESKLAEADALIAQGKRQREVAHILGVSVMTFHRWRKAHLSNLFSHSKIDRSLKPQAHDQVAELQLENLRLRRLLTDALLEKSKLEEAYPLLSASSRSIGHATQ